MILGSELTGLRHLTQGRRNVKQQGLSDKYRMAIAPPKPRACDKTIKREREALKEQGLALPPPEPCHPPPPPPEPGFRRP